MLPVSILQILICQNLRNNLQHPNEYIRGVTLRFLCRIREEEILEPLVPSILANLDHRLVHSRCLTGRVAALQLFGRCACIGMQAVTATQNSHAC